MRVCRLFEAHLKLIAPKLCAKNSTSKSIKKNIEIDTKSEELSIQPALDLISNIILPALTVSKSNPSFSRQLWRVIQLLPFQIRYSLYDNWRGEGLGKEGLGTKNSQIVMAETEALHGAKYHLKRLAKENVKLIGLKLCFFSELAPIVVYNHVSEIKCF